MTTDLIRFGAAWKRDEMPGTVTGFESAFNRFPRTLETVISPYKQEYCLKIDREESQFKFLSSDFFSVDSLWSLTDAIRSWFGRVSWFSTVSAGKRNVFVPWLLHTWSPTIHRSKAVSSLVLYEAFLLDIISFYTPQAEVFHFRRSTVLFYNPLTLFNLSS